MHGIAPKLTDQPYIARSITARDPTDGRVWNAVPSVTGGATFGEIRYDGDGIVVPPRSSASFRIETIMAHRDDPPKHRNRLADETSPYLLQHAGNPVDWYPWGDEAFEAAKAQDKPVFLSIGYSACHWCHVMERESFENEAIAALMNENFISIKVDREERPDVDQIYMAAVQALTGHGGWPMSVFLTPDGRPFYGGTYFPPADRQGMAGFPRVLQSVARAYTERRDEIDAAAGSMTEQLKGLGQIPGAEAAVDAEAIDAGAIDAAALALSKSHDPTHGGFGDAPKFPHPMDIRLLLRHQRRAGNPHSLHVARLTLDKMAGGGIYDHLGGGFARYSTDARWLVPHFEKMLYDNALLASTYIEAFQVTKSEEYARVARETLDYVLDRMTAPEGGFYSTEDADSEGVEGKYYVWTLDEVRQALGPDRSKAFAAAYDVTPAGNWEGSTILNRAKSPAEVAKELGRDEADLRDELAESRRTLLEIREQRIPPAKDTKVLASWNGLMIAAMAEGSTALGEPRYLEAARNASRFILDRMRDPAGRLLHSFKDDRARFNGYLDDYANLADGLTRLFEVGGGPEWIFEAIGLAERMLDEFRDEADGSFFYTGTDHETLIARPKEAIDNATPSSNAMAATALLRLAALTGRADFEKAGSEALEAAKGLIARAPTAAGQSLIALDFRLGPPREAAVIAGDDPAEFRDVLEAIGQRFEPGLVVAPAIPPSTPELIKAVPLLESRLSVDGRATTYVCERFACKAPVVGVEGTLKALEESFTD